MKIHNYIYNLQTSSWYLLLGTETLLTIENHIPALISLQKRYLTASSSRRNFNCVELYVVANSILFKDSQRDCLRNKQVAVQVAGKSAAS